MSVQVKRRRDTAANLASFVGAQAELLVDTTNNRVQVHDGVTAGGWPAAKLAETVTNTRTAVSDAAYAALATDRSIAFTALTAARVVTLPASGAYPTGTRLVVFDESGACSATNTITLVRAGADTIDGATSAILSSAYGYLALQSNGAGKWTIVDQATSNLGPVGVGTPADPNNPLSVYGPAALFNGVSFNVTVNKAASSDTASFIFEDGFSGRAQIGLCGSDNFSFKVSPNGSNWVTAIALDAATGAPTFANQRTAVSDAAYSALATDRLVAYQALTAARIVTLPAASAFPPGQTLIVVDEFGRLFGDQHDHRPTRRRRHDRRRGERGHQDRQRLSDARKQRIERLDRPRRLVDCRRHDRQRRDRRRDARCGVFFKVYWSITASAEIRRALMALFMRQRQVHLIHSWLIATLIPRTTGLERPVSRRAPRAAHPRLLRRFSQEMRQMF